MGILLLRVAVGIASIWNGGIYLTDPSRSDPLFWFLGSLAILLGAAILVGVLTPIVAVIAAAGAAAQALWLIPAPAQMEFDSRISTILGITIMVVIALLGPGRFSLDARLFGRREIIIPPASRSLDS